VAALARGEVVRTLPMRGTLHFVAAEDLRWMLALTSARTLQAAKTRFENLGLDAATLLRSESIATAALSDGPLSRDDFMKVLAANGIAPDGQRGYHVIFYLAQRSLVCWGPPSTTQQALVLVDDWIRPQPTQARDDVLRQFAARYFASHGPATERDFAWWSKLTLADVRAAISSCGGDLTELACAGNRYWISTAELDAASASRASAAVHALPGFDEYLLGYQDRLAPLAPEHSQRIVPGNNGIFLPTIVAGGRVVGTWRRTPKSKATIIAPEHFETASDAQHSSFARAAAGYARFIDG
jgi:Winged helix DNA-binding domain